MLRYVFSFLLLVSGGSPRDDAASMPPHVKIIGTVELQRSQRTPAGGQMGAQISASACNPTMYGDYNSSVKLGLEAAIVNWNTLVYFIAFLSRRVPRDRSTHGYRHRLTPNPSQPDQMTPTSFLPAQSHYPHPSRLPSDERL